MAVVRAFELVLDNHGAVGAHFASHDVAGKVADSAFYLFQLEVEPERLAQQREVLR